MARSQLRWGGKGVDTASLTLPSGVAVAQDGTVYVVDRGNNRVLQFKLPTLGDSEYSRINAAGFLIFVDVSDATPV